MRILLVEDEMALADVIARNLRARGHMVVHEPTAEGAILAMAQEWPDALILDVNLPDLTGWEILRRLSPVDRERLGVVVISAAPVSQKRVEEFQPLRWLQKPFAIDALVRLLDVVTQGEPAESPAVADQGEK
jgi:DNA-binding response OmpR family regulator